MAIKRAIKPLGMAKRRGAVVFRGVGMRSSTPYSSQAGEEASSGSSLPRFPASGSPSQAGEASGKPQLGCPSEARTPALAPQPASPRADGAHQGQAVRKHLLANILTPAPRLPPSPAHGWPSPLPQVGPGPRGLGGIPSLSRRPSAPGRSGGRLRSLLGRRGKTAGMGTGTGTGAGCQG